MIALLFTLLVVVGFLFWMLAAAGIGSRSEVIARACFFAASIVWAVTQLPR